MAQTYQLLDFPADTAAPAAADPAAAPDVGMLPGPPPNPSHRLNRFLTVLVFLVLWYNVYNICVGVAFFHGPCFTNQGSAGTWLLAVGLYGLLFTVLLAAWTNRYKRGDLNKVLDWSTWLSWTCSCGLYIYSGYSLTVMILEDKTTTECPTILLATVMSQAVVGTLGNWVTWSLLYNLYMIFKLVLEIASEFWVNVAA